MIAPSLLNPWVILGLLAALAGAAGGGYVRGHADGRQGVQARWDKDSAERALKASENAQRARDTEQQLQASADAERKKHAETIRDLDAKLRDLTGELSKRPDRPAAGAGAAAAAGAGANGCTGMGLFRPDALFLAGEADTGKRVKLQRDRCYAAYGEAQEALRRLSEGLAR